MVKVFPTKIDNQHINFYYDNLGFFIIVHEMIL